MAHLASSYVVFMAIVLLCSSLHAGTLSAASQGEIAHLLAYLENSGCTFLRNGTWHDPKDARAHLESKYEYLRKRSLVDSAEDFIERAASTSSMSREHYVVQCPGQAKQTSGDWLRTELARFRQSNALRDK